MTNGRINHCPTAWASGAVRPRPAFREHTVIAIRVGDNKLHLTLSRYEDGAPLDIFIDAHKEGSTVRALMDAIARQVSRGWQRGVPVGETVDQFINTRFEPSGKGSGHPAIEGRHCKSLLDAIARVIAAHYGAEVKEEVEL